MTYEVTMVFSNKCVIIFLYSLCILVRTISKHIPSWSSKHFFWRYAVLITTEHTVWFLIFMEAVGLIITMLKDYVYSLQAVSPQYLLLQRKSFSD